MPYNSQLIYRLSKDAENPADFMSRHPSNTDSEERRQCQQQGRRKKSS